MWPYKLLFKTKQKKKKHFLKVNQWNAFSSAVPLKYLTTWLMGLCACLLNNHKGLLDLCLASLLDFYSWELISLPPFFYL